MTAAFDLDVLPVVGPERGALMDGDRSRDAIVDVPSVSRELAEEALRILRVRRGGLRESHPWSDASHLRAVGAVVRQLQPIMSRTTLASSWAREASRDAAVRHAYAIRWLELARAIPAARVRRDRAVRISRAVIRGR